MKKITLLSTAVLASVILSACCQCKDCKIAPTTASTVAIEPVLVTTPPTATPRAADDAVVEENVESNWLSPAWAKWALAGSLIGVGVGVHFLLRKKK